MFAVASALGCESSPINAGGDASSGSGGVAGLGGTRGSGGVLGSGGAKGTGGVSGVGGAGGSGDVAGAGGATGLGGIASTGGTSVGGGALGAGGEPGSGGLGGGGIGSGGNVDAGASAAFDGSIGAGDSNGLDASAREGSYPGTDGRSTDGTEGGGAAVDGAGGIDGETRLDGAGGSGDSTTAPNMLSLFPRNNSVPGWTVDPSYPGTQGRVAATATTQSECENLIDGAAADFFAGPFVPTIFGWQSYVSATVIDAPAPDYAKVSLYILQMPSAAQASGLYASLLTAPLYSRGDWIEPSSPLIGTDSRIADTGDS